MVDKTLIKKLGMETIYSAKGHFKACDIRRNLVTITIWICAILSIAGLFDMNPFIGKLLSGACLFGTIALLIWNEGEGKNYRTKHKQIGEEYLALHKEMRSCYFSNTSTESEIKQLTDKVIQLDKSDKPDIPFIARKWAQSAIEQNDETDNWFL